MKNLLLLLLFVLCSAGKAQDYVFASYNVRYANHKDSVEGNGWGQRFPHIAAQIRFHELDIVGTQEAYRHQLDDLKGSLPGYDFIGVGRNDGKEMGEHSAIFYRTDRFEVVDEGNFWLAEQTDRPVKGWDAVLPRICTWGKFRDKGNGMVFLFFNLHMDHVGKVARSKSAQLVLQRIEQEMGDSIPVVLTGDFNVDQHNMTYTLLHKSGLVRDAYEAAEARYATNGTLNGFHPNRFTEQRIDHIFVSKDFRVRHYTILTDS